MDLTYVNPLDLKSLEDYLISLVMGGISLKTLREFHLTAMKLGVLTEDQNCRANTIIWDFNRLIKIYAEQMESISELLPEDFKADTILLKFLEAERKRARKLIRDGKAKNE